MTDDEMLEAYNTAVDAAMHRANERDGFASNMSRESRVAGLRAIERAAAARALEEFADQMTTGFNAGTLNAERRAIKREARARAAEIRERKLS